MAANVEVSTPALPHMNSVERISKLPVVEQTVDLANSLYGRVKETNPIINSVLSTAETTVKGAVGATIPVAKRFEGPINKVDQILCSGLDFVETNIPAVKLPADAMYKNTKEYVFGLPGVSCACQLGQQGVLRAVECACAVSEFSTQKLNTLKDSLTQENPTDVKTIFSVYLISLLNVLAFISAWVGLDLGQQNANANSKPKTTQSKPNNNQKPALTNGNAHSDHNNVSNNTEGGEDRENE